MIQEMSKELAQKSEELRKSGMDKKLLQEAIEHRKRSYSPYSEFQVGAALLTKEGKIYGGCNIENASYTPTNCAERTAFFKAISEGDTEFSAIAIVGGPKNGALQLCSPCGVCRQVMMEFCNPENFIIYLGTDVDNIQEYTLKEMLPLGFGPSNLGK